MAKSTPLLALSLTLACAASAHAADRVIGLLTLPEVFGDGPCDRFEPLQVPLVSAPDTNDVVAFIRVDKYWTFTGDASCEGLEVNVHQAAGGGVGPLPTQEYEYEAPAAIVLERRESWFRLRLADGSAWLHLSERDRYLPLQELLADRLTYLTEDWDGTLAQDPGGELRVAPTLDPWRRIVGYLEELDGDIDRSIWVEAFERPDRSARAGVRFQVDSTGMAVKTLGGIPHQIVVFDRRPGWFQVALKREDPSTAERVWLEESPVWRFHEVTGEGERERLAEQAWGREYSDVRILGFREADGALWVEIELMSGSVCTSAGEPVAKARGWVPAHSATGLPTVWFFSRGC